VFAGLFSLVALIGWSLSGRVVSWAIGVSGTLLLLALVSPSLLMPLNRAWMRIGLRLGMVSNTLLLGAFFYLVVTPFGLVGRLSRQLSMPKRPNPAARSYWTRPRREVTPESYLDMF
jgi:hypothetical protein